MCDADVAMLEVDILAIICQRKGLGWRAYSGDQGKLKRLVVLGPILLDNISTRLSSA